jgi:hypothetical protein
LLGVLGGSESNIWKVKVRMKNSECTVEQYRGDKLVRSFTPTGDPAWPWSMNVNGKSYLRTNGWVLSKILPTLLEGSPFTTKVVPNKGLASIGSSEGDV